MRAEKGAIQRLMNELAEMQKRTAVQVAPARREASVTELKRVEQALWESEEKYCAFFQQAGDSIIIIDPETGEFLDFNDMACKNLGYTREEFGKLKISDCEVNESTKEVKGHIEKVVRQGGDIFETRHRTKSGQVRNILVNTKVIRIHNKKVLHSIWRDITEQKEAERELQLLNRELLKSNRKLHRLSLKDPHTGLYNHRFFEEIIRSEFYRAKRYVQPLSMIMIDIDYFKSINDAYGHEFGDLVLKQFAKKIRKLVRLHDFVIRFGDEEFVLLLPGVNRAGVLDLAQRLLDSIRTCNFGNGENSATLRVSAAVVSYPEDNIFRDIDFIELTDKILNKVKECGGDRVYSSMDLERGKTADRDRYEEITDVKRLKQRLEKVTKQANQSLVESIFAFAKAIELKDQYTGDHVESTVNYATAVARRLDLCKDDILLVRQASMIHDLGKIGIEEKILLKKGRLTKKEFDKIREHPKIGVDIIRPVQFLHALIPLILYHHERWDGKGYPCGLKGKEIPIGARIIAIADVYHALISDRPYRKALPEERSIKIVKENSSTQFDPLVVDAFLNILQDSLKPKGRKREVQHV